MKHSVFACGAAFLLLASAASADPQPGDVYREFIWRPEGMGQPGKWQRITGPAATVEKARRKLPNAVNQLVVADLASAVRAELQLELLQSHFGTVGQAFRFNGGKWTPIPSSPHIPGTTGVGEGGPHHWLSMRYPAVPVALQELRPGANTLQFTCEGGFGLGTRWPQSILNGAILRLFYGDGKLKARGRVQVLLADDPAAIGVDLRFTPGDSPGAAIQRVDFIGRYEGFDWRGEGQYNSWHYNFRRGELRHHVGTSQRAPWQVHWDTKWLPVQAAPVAICARVIDETGLCYLTAPIESRDVALANHHSRVELLRPYEVPQRWHTRAGKRHSCKIRLPDDLAGLREVRLVVATWNGEGAGGIGVNGVVIAGNVGLNHDLSYDTLTVPLSALRPGENEFFTTSDDKEHGLEVQWPGFVLLARFEERRPGAAPEEP